MPVRSKPKVVENAGPKIAGVKWKGFTAKQKEAITLLRGPQRYTQLEGGSRSGKTWIIVRTIIKRALRYAASRHVSLRLRRIHAMESLWLDTIPKVMELAFPGLRQAVKLHTSMGYIEFSNGSEYWIGGLDDKERVDKILGREFATVHFNETSQISWPSVLKVRTRLSQKIEGLRNREIHDLNPVGRGHWSHRVFHELRDPTSIETSLDPANYRRLKMNPRDNARNIDKEYIETLANMPARYKARFFDGEYQTESDNALWSLERLAKAIGNAIAYGLDERPIPPCIMRRIVIGVDPSGTGDDSVGDEIGIIVAGLGADDRGYLLEDGTINGSPDKWTRRVKELRIKWGADLIIAERNYGGAMVESVLRNADRNSPVELVTSSLGKVLRAEPVSLMYELDRVVHCGDFPALHEEMLAANSGDTSDDLKERVGHSPNRLDAMVFAFTKLFDLRASEGVLDFYTKQATATKEREAAKNKLVVLAEDVSPLIKQPTLAEVEAASAGSSLFL